MNPTGARHQASRRPPAWVGALASLKLTLALIVLFFVAVAALRWSTLAPTWLLALPLSLLAVNLSAALWTHRGLRRSWPMFVFHLALLALLLLAALGRLTYLKGNAEVTEGSPFAGQLTDIIAGPFHHGDLARVNFVNQRVQVNYDAGPVRNETHNLVQWTEDGETREAVIGDQYPLVLAGYRIYTSRNFGFAPVLTWIPQGGMPQTGAIHLNPYPRAVLDQTREWTPPGSQAQLWFKLDFEEPLLSPEQASVLRPPTEHRLVVRFGEERASLTPGQSMNLPEGVLRYEALHLWMGYRFHYDWTIPWMLSVSLVGVFSLILHFLRLSRSRSWQRTPATASPC